MSQIMTIIMKNKKMTNNNRENTNQLINSIKCNNNAQKVIL